MYLNKIESHPNYHSYFIKGKNELIREICRNIESIKNKQKQISEFYLIEGKFKNEMDNLKEIISLQKEEIDKLIDGKVRKDYLPIRKTYLMKDNHNGLYKIGFSKNIKARESTLQSEKPSIIVIKTWDKNIESDLHKLYKDYRVRGEWFDLTKIQVHYICTHFN